MTTADLLSVVRDYIHFGQEDRKFSASALADIFEENGDQETAKKLREKLELYRVQVFHDYPDPDHDPDSSSYEDFFLVRAGEEKQLFKAVARLVLRATELVMPTSTRWSVLYAKLSELFRQENYREVLAVQRTYIMASLDELPLLPEDIRCYTSFRIYHDDLMNMTIQEYNPIPTFEEFP